MRATFSSIVVPLLMLMIGCTTVSPDECWPNTSGGFGGGGTIPIGAGVGVSSAAGDFEAPPYDPLKAESTPNPCVAPEAWTHAEFDLSEFPFVTIVKDDGKGVAGGWQEAKVNLEFGYLKVPYTAVWWYCAFRIQMPIRHHSMGTISPRHAAQISQDVTEAAAKTMDFTLPQPVFCDDYRQAVEATFAAKYPNLGERVLK